jgi:hypothetical protein
MWNVTFVGHLRTRRRCENLRLCLKILTQKKIRSKFLQKGNSICQNILFRLSITFSACSFHPYFVPCFLFSRVHSTLREATSKGDTSLFCFPWLSCTSYWFTQSRNFSVHPVIGKWSFERPDVLYTVLFSPTGSLWAPVSFLSPPLSVPFFHPRITLPPWTLRYQVTAERWYLCTWLLVSNRSYFLQYWLHSSYAFAYERLNLYFSLPPHQMQLYCHYSMDGASFVDT